MNKIFSTILLGASVLLAANLSSCKDDDNEGIVGEPSQGLYFPNTAQTSFLVPEAATQVDLTVLRTNDAEAVTAKLTLEDESGLFSVPATVSFAAGQKEAQIPVTFDATKFKPVDYTLVLTIDQADAYLYGMTEYEFTIGWVDDLRWGPYGTCKYYDYFFCDDDEFFECELQQHVVNTNQFRIVDPYKEILPGVDSDPYLYFTLLSPGQKILGQTISMQDLVYFEAYMTNSKHPNYGVEIELDFPGLFSSLNAESNWTYNKVKSYQEDGTPNVVQLAPMYYMDGVGALNYSQKSDVILIIFPGGRLMDASAEVEITSAEAAEEGGDVTIVADVTLGADVEEARVALVEGNEYETINFLITHDRAEYKTIKASGEVNFTLPADATPGIYTVMACTYSQGKPAEYNYDTYKYDPNAGKEWVKIGTGTYTYEQFLEGEDPGLELFQHFSDETLYKIEHWGYDVDFFFNMDEKGQIKVADQFMGYTHSSYGDVYVDDMVNYTGSVADGISYYDDSTGTFNFNVVYYVEAGEFGYGYETFQLDDDEADAPEARAAHKKAASKRIDSKKANMNRQDVKQNSPIVNVEKINN